MSAAVSPRWTCRGEIILIKLVLKIALIFNLFVLVEVGAVGKGLVADFADVWLFASVNSDVFAQSPLLGETSFAEITRVRFFSLVTTNVALPRVFVQERLGAELALPRSVTRVSFYMQLKLADIN